jgi:hypothetical protein
MALSSSQKQQIIELLSAGKNASEAAQEVGCSRASVQRVKKDPKFASLMQIARGMATTKQLSQQGDKVLATLSTLKEREPQMQEGLWLMFEGLTALFSDVLEKTSPEDVSPRQLPVLAKAAADIANAYADFSDRINGLSVLADEVQKINKSRAA